MRFLSRLAALMLALAPTAALSQSAPNLATGQVPTAAQWNSYFAAKQDYDPNFGCAFSPCYPAIQVFPNSVLQTNASGTPSFSDILPSGTQLPSPQFSGTTAGGILSGNFSLSTSGQAQITNTTPSTSPTTGAATIAGGLGVGGNLNVGGAITGALNTTLNGILGVTNTTNSTSPTTGAIVDSGGLGVGGNLSVGGAVVATPTVAIGSGTYQPSWSGRYYQITASGAIGSTNTLSLPAGPTYPLQYGQCSDTATASGGSQSNPRIATCLSLYYPNLGVGTGDRAGLDIGMAITGNTSQTEGDAYYNGAIATILANSNLGGTGSSQVGDVYGLSTQIALQSGATYYASVHGAGEWDLQVDSGASVTDKVGGEIALVTGDAVQGTNIDAGLIFTDRGSTAWKYGIEFGLPSGQGGSFPVQGGTIIGSYAGGSAANGVAFGNIVFSGCAFQANGFCVNNNHITFSQGNSPSGVTCTGLGTGGSCNDASGGPSTDAAGEVVLTTGTSPSNAGTVTITFGQPMGTNASDCQWMLQSGASQWPTPALAPTDFTNLLVTNNSTSANTVQWASNVSLAANTTYALSYLCVGR